MSRFTGIYNLDGKPVAQPLLKQMTDSMAARGPDALHTWLYGPLGFGHTLLKTTWESEHENQPLTFDTKVWITGDIRLDRRDELIDRLTSAGLAPDTNAADVDLLLHAYLAWQENCLEYLSGDFAFILWDNSNRSLFAARDHFGIVPFYYAETGKTLVFSNDIKSLQQHPGISDRLDEHTIGDILLFGMNRLRSTTISVVD